MSNEKITFNLSRELSDIRKQKKKLEQMEGYMADSKGLIDEREAIVEKIDYSMILAYQLELESLKESALELQKSIDHSVDFKTKLSKCLPQLKCHVFTP